MRTELSKAINTAQTLREDIAWVEPEDYSIEEVANSLGIWVKNDSISGAEGRILINGDSGIISVNSKITLASKRNFIIAHEIGHFLMHKSLKKIFSDDKRTLSAWYKSGPHEIEANEFAAELLMPSDLFEKKVAGRKLEIKLIKEVSAYFHTSLTATFLRYLSCGKYPLMIIFSENGVVKWKQCSSDFPFPFLPIGFEVPTWTVTGDLFHKNISESDPVKVKAIEWFPDNFKLQYDPNTLLFEQCFKVSENGIITCLWA